ncbi:MAG: O-antigen ligase family protein [Moorea sp. SIO4G3]|nr:O-antigen ligase family protein [Moorena sp. SIO4G3]
MATTQFGQIATIGKLLRWAILIIGCGLAAKSGFRRAGHKYKILTWADRVIIAFLLLFLISETWTIQPWLTAQKSISIILLYGCSFWVLWDYADHFSEQLLIHKLLQALGIIFTINLLSMFLLPNVWLAGRFRGFFHNPNNIGLILGLAIPLAAAQWLRTRERLFVAIVIIFSLNLVACGSRSPMLGIAVAMVAILISLLAKRPNQAIAISLLAMSGLAFFIQTDFFTENIVRESTLTTASNRTYFWDLAKTYIAHRPDFGHGFGTETLIHEHYGIVLTDLQLRGHGVMSSYYGLAVQIGWPFTYCFFGLLWAFVVYCCVKYWRNYELVTLVASLASGLIICIFEPAIYSAGNIFSFLFWMILMLAVRRKCYQKWRLSP